MSRRRKCWDNAVAESFFSTPKKERIRNQVYYTRDKAGAEIFDYIEVFYDHRMSPWDNRSRHHSHLEEMIPEAFEEIWRKQA